MQLFALLFGFAVVVASFGLLLAALLFVLGLCWRIPTLKIIAGLLLAAAGLVAAPVLLMLAWDDSGPPEAVVRRQIAGTYRGHRLDFDETITVTGGPTTFSFRHRLERDGRVEGEELGAATVMGSEITFEPFTVWVESETGSLKEDPRHFVSYSYSFLSGPPSDILKPFVEHDYYLRKVDQ